MKKKWIIVTTVLLLVVIAVVAVLIINLNAKPSASIIVEHCWEHVTNISIVEQEDGTVEVKLTAPSYGSLVKLLASEKDDTITEEKVLKAVECNPQMVKEYAFTAFSSAETDIKKALMEQISYELVALTLGSEIGG